MGSGVSSGKMWIQGYTDIRHSINDPESCCIFRSWIVHQMVHQSIEESFDYTTPKEDDE